MNNETIYKLLTSTLDDDVHLGYELFTHKFKEEILNHPDGNGYIIHPNIVARLLEIDISRVYFSINWDKNHELLL